MTVDTTGRWRDLLIHCGIDEKLLDGKHHDDCPICGRGTKRFRFDDKDGQGTWFCNQCGAGNGFTLLRAVFRWSDREIFQRLEALIGECRISMPYRQQQDEIALRRQLNKIYYESTEITEGDPVWRYLERRCGWLFPPFIDLRYHPELPCTESKSAWPAMIGLMGWDGKKYSGIHRTWLTIKAEKAPLEAPKKMLGQAGPIRIYKGDHMHLVAEGIETAIAASNDPFFDYTAVWSASNAHQLAKFGWPNDCAHLLIAGDNDVNYTGQAAANVLAHRLAIRGHSLDVRIPKEPGTDWCKIP
jgi:putative DNA primase/helicase